MTQYKKGRRVILLKSVREVGLYYNPNMDKFVGKTAIITGNIYGTAWAVSVDGEDTGYEWHEDWLRLVGSCPCNITMCIKHRITT